MGLFYFVTSSKLLSSSCCVAPFSCSSSGSNFKMYRCVTAVETSVATTVAQNGAAGNINIQLTLFCNYLIL
ncbi:MAG: hypothetical protein EAZ16_07570 [Sphingobacteriales bacterium]|nr:MAG: hypothetical protein EAZ16_07570 [Sphingobacteriales bacterium]